MASHSRLACGGKVVAVSNSHLPVSQQGHERSEEVRLPRIIVLLATHNGLEFIKEQIDSILSQRDVWVRILAGDDGSTDGTLEWLMRLAREESRIQVLPQGSFGSAADNFLNLLRESFLDDVDYVALSDQDDIWLPDKLRRAVDKLRATRSEGYSSDLIAFDQMSGRRWRVRKFGPARLFDYLFGGGSAGCTYVLSLRAISAVRIAIHSQPLPGWSHDWLIYAICRSHGLKWSFDSAARILYRQHQTNAYGARLGVRGVMWRLSQFQNGWYRRQILNNARYLRRSPEELRILSRVDRLRISDRLWLAANGWRFRRKLLDAFALSMFAIFMRRIELD